MLVKDCMTKHPIMVAPDTAATEAQRLMSENNVRHLPVVEDGKRLVGLVTRESFALSTDTLGSLNVWEISRYLGKLTVKKVMVKVDKLTTISSNITIERGAQLMVDGKLNGLIVVDDGIVVGILSQVDLLKAFQLMLGLPSEGVRATVRMPDRKGEFAKLMGALAEKEYGVMGIGTYPTRKRDGSYDAVLKIRGGSTEAIAAALNAIPEQTVVDIRDVV